MATATPPPTIISTIPDLLVFLSSVSPSSTLYLDLEGKRLSRHGSFTLMTVLVHTAGATSLIDVQTLGTSAFTTLTADGKTLKPILKDPKVSKCLWDAGNYANALWAHYRVRLAGVTNIQHLENASRVGDKTCFRRPEPCVQSDPDAGVHDPPALVQDQERGARFHA